MNRHPNAPTYSPWGSVQTSRELFPGAWSVSTASHGGIYLAAEEADAIRSALPGFEPYTGWPWFEEDEDVTVIFLVFAAHFDDEAVWSSVRSVRNRIAHGNPSEAGRWGIVARWLTDTADGRAAAERADTWSTANADRWETGGGGTSGHGWTMHLYRISDGERRMMHFPEYPAQRFYTSAELDALDHPNV